MIASAAIEALAKLPPLPAEEMRRYALEYPCVKYFEAKDAGFQRDIKAGSFVFRFSLFLDMTGLRGSYRWIAMGGIRYKRNPPPHFIPPQTWGSPFDQLMYSRLKELIGEFGSGDCAAQKGKQGMTVFRQIAPAELERLSHVIAAHTVFNPWAGGAKAN